jgi:malonyl-CoA/methylmalonyl-CoA synthetase
MKLSEQWQAVRGSDRTAVIDADGAHGFGAIDERAGKIAASLRIEPGERVAIDCPPGAGFVAAFFGILRAGGCAIVLSPQHPKAERDYFLADAHVRTVLSGDEPRTGTGPFSFDSDVLQLYTSGTTGKPKGAVHTDSSLGAQMEILHGAWKLSAKDTLLHVLPLHHMHGLCIALLPMLTAGGCTRMLPKFDAHGTWDAMADATVFMAVPTIYGKLLAAFDAATECERARWKENARRLRLATSGSAALPVGLAERWRTIAGDIPLERFGMTEIGVGCSNPLEGLRKPGSVGRALMETRVIGGELQVRGPGLFSRYFERPEATREAFDDGWFKTGDTVSEEGDGTFRILGRTSVDILKSGGYKLSALEIEEVLREHPAIAEVAVVGMPDETWGERVVACIIPKGAAPSAEDVRAFAKERMASYKVPKDVIVMEDFPRSSVGKVIKPELVSRLRALR